MRSEVDVFICVQYDSLMFVRIPVGWVCLLNCL